ncbi:terminase gpA endonuclease subunit [Thiorhodococcus fuscus]|uniref:Terminase gpA endonuclease subunit n=1 Tax=Thiorhodococcus fuscus TaxID=527200 RepID=A0ABW4YB11_9GAMM
MGVAEYADIHADLAGSLDALNRPRRIPVSQGAAETLHLDDKGGYSGPWRADEVPYMIEPMDMLASRQHQAVCFVGPARSGKTAALVLGWIAHALTNDPGRMMVMHMSQEKADLLSKLDIDTAIDASPALLALKSSSRHDDTIRLKIFRHGMAIRLAWPSRSEMAGTTYRYVAMTDYDRYTEQRGMGGSIFDSASKRTQTLMSRGMVLVESSPERTISDPRWSPASPHEAPPCGGILGIYNRSDRRRFYWRCPHCGEWFEAAPGLKLFSRLPGLDTLRSMVRTLDIRQFAADHARITCPHYGCEIEHEQKFVMNTAGVWVPEGQNIDAKGAVCGPAPTASIAGYWLGGVAAAYQSWQSLLENYLQGVRELELTGKEETLEAKTYVDQAMPYLSVSARKAGDIDHIDARQEDYPRYIIPAGVRGLLALVDTQKWSFEVAVIGHGVDNERWLIDRFSILETPAGEKIQPPVYIEHWDVLLDRVINATYKLPDGREMRVHFTAIDSGGHHDARSKKQADQSESTRRAYDFWRKQRRAGLGHRLRLLKGASSATAPLVHESYPEARKDRHAGARGDIPVLMLNVDRLKDALDLDLQREVPGPSYIHLPAWLPKHYREEIKAEQKGQDGRWHKIGSRRNETWDHLTYDSALWLHLGGDKVRWEAPPAWLRDWDANPEIITAEQRRALKAGQVSPKRAAPSNQNTTFGKPGWGL